MMLSAVTITNAASTQPTAEAICNDGWHEALAAKVIEGMHMRTVSIGRGQGCMVRIGRKATTISRIHAEISDTGSSRYVMRVLGTNGIRLNGMLHTKGTTVDLQAGDEISFVGVKYKFRVPQEQQAVVESASESVDAGVDDWWPEPVRKRVADSDNIAEQPAHKRARELSSEYRNSTDTLVDSSDPGHLDSGKPSLLAKQ
ncbi:hypothetical protein EV175_005338, partial [Coemansia sp. RSA 1933]